MKKEFTANLLFLIGINLVIKPFYALAIDTTVQNKVGPEEYGLFLALFNFVYIQQIFADLGIQNYNNRNISRFPEQLKDLLPKILGSKVLFTLGFILVVGISSWFFNYSKYLNEILVWIIGTQASLSFLLYCRTNISGIGKYYTDSFFSVLDKLILIIWLSYLLWFNNSPQNFEIIDFVKAQFYSVSTSLMICLIYTHFKINKISFNLDLKFTSSLLKQSLPYATLVLLMAGYSRIDGIMLEQLLNDNALEAGKYASSFRLYDTFNNFTFLFAVLLLPMFSKMIIKKESVNALVIWSFSLLSLASILIIIISYIEGDMLLSFFYDRMIDNSYTESLLWLMIAGLPLSLNYIYGTLLTANGNLKLLNKIAIGGFAMNVGLNWLLIPKFGAPGAAFATMITQSLVLIFQLKFATQIFKLNIPGNIWFRLLIMLGIAFVMVYTTRNFFGLSLWLGIMISTLVYILMAFLLKLIKIEDIQKLRTIKQ